MANELQNRGVYDDAKPGNQEAGGGLNRSPYDQQAAAGKPYNPAGYDVASGDRSDPRGEGSDSFPKRDELGNREAGGAGGQSSPSGGQTSSSKAESPGTINDREQSPDTGQHFTRGEAGSSNSESDSLYNKDGDTSG